MSATQRWGLYPWFEEDGPELIHPEDIAIVRSLLPNGKVFQQSSVEGDYIKLRYGDVEIRVRESLFRPLPVCPRSIGSTVTLKDGRVGEVVGIQWHHKRDEPMYQLRIEGKKKSFRYWEADFGSPPGPVDADDG